MAACQITITGTTGSVDITYTVSGTTNVITAAPGALVYIDSSSTAVTYTNLSGDAAATSGCVSITNLPASCYLFKWIGRRNNCIPSDYFTAVILGGVTTTISSTRTYYTYPFLVAAMRAANIPNVGAMSGKYTTETDGIIINQLVVRVVGSNIPYLRITDDDFVTNTYVRGEASTCFPSGFTQVDDCVYPNPDLS